MKKLKFITLTATALLAVGILTACGSSNDDTAGTSEPATTETTGSESSDVTSGATVNVTDSFEDLQAALSADGDKASWIAAASGDIDASGKTLTVDGHFQDPHGTNPARKLALYTQNADHQVTATFTLTVDKLIVNSPGFYISDGTVKGDVEVNADGFHFQAGKKEDGTAVVPSIDGNLTFSTQEQLDEFNARPAEEKGNVTGTVSVKE